MNAEYITIRTAPNRAAAVAKAIASLPSDPEGAEVTAGFTALIGLSINCVTLLARADDADRFDRTANALAKVADVTGVERVALGPVQERNLACLAADGAMYTNRWFHVREPGASEFEADTLAAWDAFETGTDSQVVGLWKRPAEGGVVSYLLIARYTDLDGWSRSRFWNRPEEDRKADWVERFQRRREQMVDSSVIATTCVFGPDR